MNTPTPRHFIRAHQAKFAWKLFRHGVGVLVHTEKREGAGRYEPIHYAHVRPEDFLA